MELFFLLLANFVVAILSVIELAMFLRMILSWFMPDSESAFVALLLTVTEPVILPFRLLFHRLNWFQSLPIDIAFFVAFLTVSTISTVLSVAV